MAKITRSQAKYIEAKFAEFCWQEQKKLRDTFHEAYQARKEAILRKYRKKYPRWADRGDVIAAMARKDLENPESNFYECGVVQKFDKTVETAKSQLHETLLFSDGSLEEAQTILNQFINKLKENQ